MKEYIELIEYLSGEFSAYNVGLQDEMELAEKVSDMMEANRAAFIAFNQERTDKGLSIMPIDVLLMREVLHFLNLDEKRFSGMDIEKGYYNKADALHILADRWVSVYIQCYTSPLKDEQQAAQDEPQQEANQPNDTAYLDILPKKLVDGMIAQGLVERAGKGLKWMKSAALYGYFIDLVSKKLDLRYSNGKINWKIFGFIENHKAMQKTASVEVSNYNNEHKNPPEGDYIINNLLKEIEI